MGTIEVLLRENISKRRTVGQTSIRGEGAGRGCLAYLSALGMAMKPLTNTVQASAGPTARTTALGMVALLMGDHVLVGELVVNCLDGRVDPVGPALRALSTRDEGVPLLGCGPQVALGLALSMAIASAVACHQYRPVPRGVSKTNRGNNVLGHDHGVESRLI